MSTRSRLTRWNGYGVADRINEWIEIFIEGLSSKRYNVIA